MTQFVLTRLARQDLEEIWDRLALDNPNAASRVLDRIEKAAPSSTARRDIC